MQDWLPKLESRERWFFEHFALGISIELLIEDRKLTKYDAYLLQWWGLYHYYNFDYNVLPKSKDGGLNYGMIKSMRALDQLYRDGEEHKKTAGETGDVNNNDENVVDV